MSILGSSNVLDLHDFGISNGSFTSYFSLFCQDDILNDVYLFKCYHFVLSCYIYHFSDSGHNFLDHYYYILAKFCFFSSIKRKLIN